MLDNPFLGTFEDIAGADYFGSLSDTDWNKYANAIKSAAGGLDLGGLLSAGAGAGLGALLKGSGSQKPTGYQGKVPSYQAIRQQVPMAEQDPARRPGSGGRQYFTNTQYLPKSDATGIAAAQQAMQQQSDAIAQANLAPTQGQRTALLNAAQSVYPMYVGQSQAAAPAAPPAAETTSPSDNEGSSENNQGNPMATVSEAAHGGLIGLARGGSTGQPRFLAGGTDGMADKIPATIEGGRPAKLGHGEFVIPADVVGALGSGNSEAGAKVLYDMMDRVRKHAHGTKKQIKPANLKKTLPA